jgi:hypothetical protein
MNGNPFGSQLLLRPWRAIRSIYAAKSVCYILRPSDAASVSSRHVNSSPTDRVTSVCFSGIIRGEPLGGMQAQAQGLTDSPKVSIRLSTRLNLGRLSRNIRQEHLQAYGGYHSSSASTKCKLLSPYDGAIASLGNKSRMRLLGSATELADGPLAVGGVSQASPSAHPLSLCSPLHHSSSSSPA